MIDFTEAMWKMDKWAYEDEELQDDYYKILDDEEMSEEDKIEEMEDLLGCIIQDEDRLHHLVGQDFTDKELATWIIKNGG